MPSHTWEHGNTYKYLLNVEGLSEMAAYCRLVLNSHSLREQLSMEKYDMAIVDLSINECNLALAHHLGSIQN